MIFLYTVQYFGLESGVGRWEFLPNPIRMAFEFDPKCHPFYNCCNVLKVAANLLQKCRLFLFRMAAGFILNIVVALPVQYIYYIWWLVSEEK